MLGRRQQQDVWDLQPFNLHRRLFLTEFPVFSERINIFAFGATCVNSPKPLGAIALCNHRLRGPESGSDCPGHGH
jgi:hypothetical protein